MKYGVRLVHRWQWGVVYGNGLYLDWLIAVGPLRIWRVGSGELGSGGVLPDHAEPRL